MDESSDQLATAHARKLHSYFLSHGSFAVIFGERMAFRHPPMGSRRSRPAGQCIDPDTPRLSLSAMTELEEN